MKMPDFRFSVIVSGKPRKHDEVLDAADGLAQAGCTDASLRGHAEGMELMFVRSGRSLQTAIASAIEDIESVGHKVVRVEMEREAIRI
jgi:hypothetical protein